MKKLNLFFVALIIMIFTFACGGGNSNQQIQNNDIVGEADSLSPNNGKKSETNAVKAKLNGQAAEFAYVDVLDVNMYDYNRFENGSYSYVRFELGSNEKMKEKIAILLTNYDLDQLTFPLTIAPGIKQGKAARIDLNIQKSNVFIPYSNQDDFSITLNSYKDEVLEGIFSADAKNTGGKIINIAEGSFKVKLRKTVQKAAQ
jgi:hypothetical protein